MALSNWDTMAIDHAGNPCDGTFTSPLGVTVEVYKNGLHVHDKRSWRDGGESCEPIVMRVHKGEFSYQDVNIQAMRGPQNGIYAVVWSGNWSTPSITGMVCCGVYGYKDHEWVGVLPESVAWLQKKLKNGCASNCKPSVAFSDVPRMFYTLDFSKVARFNQGDAFFAANFGGDVPDSAPGAPEPPVIHALIGELRNNEAETSEKLQ